MFSINLKFFWFLELWVWSVAQYPYSPPLLHSYPSLYGFNPKANNLLRSQKVVLKEERVMNEVSNQTNKCFRIITAITKASASQPRPSLVRGLASGLVYILLLILSFVTPVVTHYQGRHLGLPLHYTN